VARRLQVQVAGWAPQALLDTIRLRFGEITVSREVHTTVLNAAIADQPALRAFLGTIWDSGCDVLRVVVEAPSGEHGG
jgi:hypothetical protein